MTLLGVRAFYWVSLVVFAMPSLLQAQERTYHPLAISSREDFSQQTQSFDDKMAQTKEQMEQTFYDEAKVMAYEAELKNLDYELPGPIYEGDEIIPENAWISEEVPVIEVRE